MIKLNIKNIIISTITTVIFSQNNFAIDIKTNKDIKKTGRFHDIGTKIIKQQERDAENTQKVLGFLEKLDDMPVVDKVLTIGEKALTVTAKATEDLFKSREDNIIKKIQLITDSLNKPGQPESNKEMLENRRKQLISRLEEIGKQNDKTYNSITSSLISTAASATDVWTKNMLAEKNLEKSSQREITKNIIEMNNRFKNFYKKENLIKGSIASVGIFGGITILYQSSKLGYNYLDAKIGKPTLIQESNRFGLKESFYNLFRRNKIITNFSIDEVILEPKTQITLYAFANEVKDAYANGLPFRNALFYGLPGTGKTMFAKAMAQYCGMEYAIMSGADFSQFKDGESIVELHKLFDWAKNSKRGLLIFIDEADSFLRDRRVLNTIEKNLLNAFLSRTGTDNKKVIFIFATNYENELDPAVLSRIHKKIEFVLPSLNERIQILNMYLQKYIINDQREILKNNRKVEISIELSEKINSEFIEKIADQIEGFSGRDIEQLISELRIASYNKGNGTLSTEIVNDVVIRKIKEHKHDMAISKMQRQRYNKELGKIITIK